MKIGGLVREVDGATVTVDRPLPELCAGDMLFAAEPGEHIAYQRVPTGGWHFTWVELVVLAVSVFTLGAVAGCVAF